VIPVNGATVRDNGEDIAGKRVRRLLAEQGQTGFLRLSADVTGSTQGAPFGHIILVSSQNVVAVPVP
jgi:hypothetical protein